MFLGIWVASFFLTGVMSLLFFDRIVRFQCERCTASWRSDGAPFGFFWKPEGFVSGWVPDNYPNYSARNRLSRRWFFRTPVRASSEPVAVRAFRWYRIAVSASLVTWCGMVLSMFGAL